MNWKTLGPQLLLIGKGAVKVGVFAAAGYFLTQAADLDYGAYQGLVVGLIAVLVGELEKWRAVVAVRKQIYDRRLK